MFGRRKNTIPSAEEALPGRAARLPVPEQHFVNGGPPRAALPGRHGARPLRPRLLLGRRAQVLGSQGRVLDAGGLRRRLDAEPDLRGGLQRARPGTPRSCGSSSTRRVISYDELLADLLGEPRPDAGHAPGQRRRHAVPLGDLLLRAGAASPRPRPRARLPADARQGRATGAITTEIREAPEFYYAEDYHQQYLAKNPWGYCGIGGTGVSCPSGLVSAEAGR